MRIHSGLESHRSFDGDAELRTTGWTHGWPPIGFLVDPKTFAELVIAFRAYLRQIGIDVDWFIVWSINMKRHLDVRVHADSIPFERIEIRGR
jgi:hypothetical protein